MSTLLYSFIFVFLLPHFNADCPAGTIQGYLPHTCYLLSKQDLPWFEAENFCVQNGGHITSVTSSFENTFLAGVEETNFPGSEGSFWLGGSDAQGWQLGNWTWTDENNFLYTNWDQNQPGSTDVFRCASMTKSSGLWSSNGCDTAKAFVCKLSDQPVTVDCPHSWTYFDKTKSCYKAFYGPNYFTWTNSKSLCEKFNSTLTSIHSYEENQFLAGLTAIDSNYKHFYIGLLFNNNAFGWVDGTSFDYQNIPDYKPGFNPGSSYICCRIISTNDSFGLWELERLNYYEPWNIGPICKKSAYT